MSLAFAKAVTFIMTRDRARAEAYYGDMLCLKRLSGDDFAAAFEIADATLRITEIAGYEPSPHPALGWTVDDLGTVMTALADKGVTFTIYDGFGQDAQGIWTSPDGTTKLAWFNDPDGNVLTLTQG